jgi:hypothetical protein
MEPMLKLKLAKIIRKEFLDRVDLKESKAHAAQPVLKESPVRQDLKDLLE